MNEISFSFLISVCVTSSIGEPSPIIVSVEGGLSGSGVTTYYWDWCKPSCSWAKNLEDETKTPVASCASDGETPLDPNDMSGCDDGPAYMCANQQPFEVNSTLAYGFTAASFGGSADTQSCCGCVLLSFQGKLKGKKFLVQVTNTGSDLVSNQFYLAVPGVGVGLYNGCAPQRNAPADGWGQRYGGETSEADCDELPVRLRDGCKFRFGFMEGVPVPKVSFQQVQCPTELVAITGCDL